MCGNPHLDFDALERNAKYEGGFGPHTPAVMWLWHIVKHELSMDERKMFLKFFTGSDRLEGLLRDQGGDAVQGSSWGAFGCGSGHGCRTVVFRECVLSP